MKVVYKFVADDGTEFGSREECIQYEHTIQFFNVGESLPTLDVVTKNYIKFVYVKCGGNVTQTCDILDIARTTFYRNQ